MPGRFLIAALIGLVAALWTLTRPGDPALYPVPSGQPSVTVYLLDNGFHTDLAVPRAALNDRQDDQFGRAFLHLAVERAGIYISHSNICYWHGW